jgi:hypothetical protein
LPPPPWPAPSKRPRSGQPAGGWRFGGYNLASTVWTEFTGSVDAGSGTIRIDVPASFFGDHGNQTGPVTAQGFHAEAWISTAYADPQWGDWAQSDAVLAMATAAPPTTLAEKAPAPADAQVMPAPSLALLVVPLAAAALILRRRA